MRVYYLKISEFAKDEFAYEFFNEHTHAMFYRSPDMPMVHLETGEHVVHEDGDVIVHIVNDTVQSPITYRFANGEETMEKKNIHDNVDQIVCSFHLYDASPILLTIRAYKYAQVDQGRDQYGWSRIADTHFSLDEMNVGITKTSFLRSDLYFMDDATRKEFKGYGQYTILPREIPDTRAIKQFKYLQGHPMSDLIECTKYASKEHDILLNKVTPTPYAKQYATRKYLDPFYYYVPGLPCNKQWPEGLIYSTHTFFMDSGIQPVTVDWLLARLEEVLLTRGIDPNEFLHLTEEMKHVQGHASLECMIIINQLLRMHTCTRPYVPDHAWLGSKFLGGDQETKAFHLPGDCEDSSCTIYLIHMYILFHDEVVHSNNPLLQAIRSCAAYLGVPAVVCGTFLDPLKELTTQSYGHMYPVAIPFVTFFKAIGDTKRLSEVYERTFGFPLPTNHVKPVIMEGVFHTSMFYGDHDELTSKKYKALETVYDWLKERKEYGDQFWCWRHFTCMLPLDRVHRAHGHAFRVYTEILDRFEINPKVEYIVPGKEETPCRTFLVMSNLGNRSVDKLYDQIFPHGTKFKNTIPYIKNQVIKGTLGTGCGIPIELFANGHQSLENGEPVFRLKGIYPVSKKVLKSEHYIRQVYDRPMLPLPAHPPDYFMHEVKYPLNAHIVPNTLQSKTRVTIYVYDVEDIHKEISTLLDKLGAQDYFIYPYAFSTAVVIPI